MIKKGIFFLVLLAGILGCDDIIFTDGKTLAEGHVIDSLTNKKVPNVLVYLSECHLGFQGIRCNSILDSTRTNVEGYYRFQFKDRRKMDFGVGLAQSSENNFYALPLVGSPNSGPFVIDGDEYLIKEGRKNEFDFYIKLYITIPVNIRLQDTGYQHALLYGQGQSFYLSGLANRLDTMLQVKVLPQETNYLSLLLMGFGKADTVIAQSFFVDPTNIPQVIFEK